MDAGWFTLDEARLNLKPYQRPRPPVAIAALLSPSGPRVAGRFGLPLLSLAATSPMFTAVLADHWQIMEGRAAEFGVEPPRRADWRLVGPMHLAESREEAERDVAFGLEDWAAYFFRDQATFNSLKAGIEEGPDRTLADVIRDSGMGVIGPPDDAIALIERLQEQSGGFGSYMLLHHEWANRAATRRSYELFAHYVMPHFQDAGRRAERWQHMRDNIDEQSDAMAAGVAKARADHDAEVAAKAETAARPGA
jgi:limonene 1,2-monooxygenase